MNNELTLWEQAATPTQIAFSWDKTFAETKELVKRDAELTTTIDEAMVERFHVRVRIGFNLIALQKGHAKDGHGDFTTVELPKLGIADRKFAYRCINVARLFEKLGGDLSVPHGEQTDLLDLPMPIRTWENLASPSGQTVVQQLESGEIKPTQEDIKKALDDLAEQKKRAKQLEQDLKEEREQHSLFKDQVETNKQAHVALVQSLEQKLEAKPEPVKVIEYQDTLETAANVAILKATVKAHETKIYELQGKPTIPPETLDELTNLQQELKNAKTELGFYEKQNKDLADKNKQLSEESRRSFTENITAVGQLRIRQEWQFATGEVQAAIRKFHTKVPSEIDRGSFEGEENTRTYQTIELLEQTAAMLKKKLLGSDSTVNAQQIPLLTSPGTSNAIVIGIPPEYQSLFNEYEQKLLSSAQDSEEWSTNVEGYITQTLPVEKHIQFTRELLSSRVDRRIRAALSAMKIALGTWEG